MLTLVTANYFFTALVILMVIIVYLVFRLVLAGKNGQQTETEKELERLHCLLEERTLQLQEAEKQFSLNIQQNGVMLKQFLAIMNNTTTAVYLKDLKGRYLLINRQVEKLFGLKQPEVIGKTDQELFPDDNSIGKWNTNNQLVLTSGKSLEIEEEIWLADGLHTMLSFKFPILDETGKVYALGVTSHDITAQKRAEQENDKFVLLVENSTNFVAFADPKGQMLYVNAAGRKLVGLSSLEAAQQVSFLDFVSDQDHTFVREKILPQLMEHEHWTGELPIQHFETGESIPLYNNSFLIKDRKTQQLLAIANIAYDLTERKRAEETVRANQARLAGIISSAMDTIITINSDRRVVAFNQAAEKMFGCSANDALYQTLDRFIPERFRLAHDYYITTFGQTGSTTRSMGSLTSLYALRADGQEFPIEATISQADAEGQKYYTVVIRDITERVQAYQLLEHRVAERTAEMATLLEISHNVAATLNLTAMAGLLLDQLKHVINYDSAMFFTYLEGKLTLIDARMPLSRSDLEMLAVTLAQSPIYQQVITDKNPLIIEDALSTTLVAHESNYARSGMIIPLVVKDRAIGIFSMTHSVLDYYTPHHAQLAQAIAYQAAVAVENARLYEQAQELAALEERHRLARELHDSTSQVLYSIQLASRAIRNFLQQNQVEQATETVDYVLSLAKGGLDEMRALIFDLRPESLEKEGLLGALQKQIVSLEARHGILVEAHFSRTTEPELPLEYKKTLYSVAREALHNVVKHANADQVNLQLDWDDQIVQLIVQDFGQGFETTGEFSGHFGLHSMQERAQRLLGSKLTIESKLNIGTKVYLCIPMPGYSLQQTTKQ